MTWGSVNCGVCKKNNTVQKIISHNYLKCICKSCRHTYEISLIKIIKKIIYLDQNIFSNAYAISKGKESRFKLLIDKLENLTNKQLIICPFSDVHDLESHQQTDDGKALFSMIQTMSRGKRFYLRNKIKEQQIINAYIAFLNNDSDKYKLKLSDAIEPGIHDWDTSFRIQSNFSLSQFISPAIIKKEKKLFTEDFIEALPKFHKMASNVQANFISEITDHARFLIEDYMQAIKSNDIKIILNSEEVKIINTLMRIDTDNQNIGSKFNQVISFLKSSYFANIPYVHISSGIWAVKRKEISDGRCPTNLDKHRKQIRGFLYDIEHAAIFAPYCDAMITEIKMAQYLKGWHKQSQSLYPFNVYSIQDEANLYNYLDYVENTITEEMEEELKIVYGEVN
ncbi:hypothetical protein Lfee_0902 [Legionella feeleii]|uniref:Uncharacterized protein n=1 Tax=Legionella feeleii TaxID=453 RepID=A0A0W0U1L5_9GAMM|nr:hypothetical protein Lfee_0902 [Legionella feeleii]SPX62213.1 Uncharacterised protein [Legionella feeleii]